MSKLKNVLYMICGFMPRFGGCQNLVTLLRETKNYKLYRLQAVEVPALLLEPSAPPPYPAILFLHYYRGSKDNLRVLANEIGKAGFLALAIDMEYHGDRAREGKDVFSPDIHDDRLAFERTVQDGLRALYFLENHPYVKKDQLFLWGVSLGSIIGTLIAGRHQQLRGVFLVVGGGNLSRLLKESMLDSLVELRYHLLKRGIAVPEALKGWEALDPLYHVGSLDWSTPLFMYNGTKDDIVPPLCTLELFETVSSFKKIRWFPTGHGLLFERSFGVPQLVLEEMKSLL
ncbi:prolyl oligopeptidase family serine peptidase [Thermatribacter velox]|uniref:Prolyl oligopeptidase family serine peptidase n=1 Tax=Thermatribacter velox TaxID=3039681 RepID=A0ABZ2YEN0_9BACT